MYLKFLYVEGFKSFPEPSGLELDPGVCVFVGANGTGKSNLTDAVTWAFGEQDLVALRCRTADDLRFAGSSELLPLQSGEVTLVLDPRPPRAKLEALPLGACKHGHAARHTREVPEGALTITRRMHEDGTTSLSVDGSPVSEEELAARLAASGLGSPPVSVIRQGELERLLLLDPPARRRLIEEAIGIPELGRRHDRLAEEAAATRLRRQHLEGEREEVSAREAELESEVRVSEQARDVLALQARLRARAVRSVLGDADAHGGGAGTTPEDLLALLGLPTGDGADGPKPDASSWEELRLALDRCACDLQNLGPINTRAAEDLAATRAHRAALDSSFEVIESQIATLEEGVEAARAEMERAFATALERIETRFRELYQLLAPGGEAAFRVAGDGVEIVVRPPGKVLDRVSSLSGGERSLAALSLALAVFQEYDSHIFVLDEVEPALDDTNIRRLQAVLDSVADGRQLLMVSHQQRAKETGDVVFGVERNLDGASQVKFRFEPATRRLDVFRRTWTADHLRRFPGDKVKTGAPGLAADAPTGTRSLAGGAGSPMQATLMEIRGPRSGPAGYRAREDGPWEGIWESMGNSSGADGPKPDDDPPQKTCC